MTAGQLVANIVARPPLPLPETGPLGRADHRELADIVIRALQKEPAARYASMAALAEALVPFEITQQLAVANDDDPIEIDEAAPDEDGDIELDVEVEEAPSRSGKSRALLASVLVLATAAAAGRCLWPVLRGPGGTASRAAVAAHRLEAQVQAGPAGIAPTAPPLPAVAAALAVPVSVEVASPPVVERPAPVAKAAAKRGIGKKHRSQHSSRAGVVRAGLGRAALTPGRRAGRAGASDLRGMTLG